MSDAGLGLFEPDTYTYEVLPSILEGDSAQIVAWMRVHVAGPVPMAQLLLTNAGVAAELLRAALADEISEVAGDGAALWGFSAPDDVDVDGPNPSADVARMVTLTLNDDVPTAQAIAAVCAERDDAEVARVAALSLAMVAHAYRFALDRLGE